MVDDGPDEATRAAAERHGARYLRPRRAARSERRAQHRACRPPTRRSCASSTTTSRCARAGSMPCWPRRRRAPTRSPSSPAPSAPASRAIASGPAAARARRSPSSTSAPPTATATTRGAPTWRSAAARSQRVGTFDEARELYGDEQEWQARAEGRRRAHPLRRRRGARPPPRGRRRAPALAVPRRLPPRPGQPALRRLQGHGALARSASCACSPAACCTARGGACMNGPVLAAHSLGRLRAALAASHRRCARPRTSSRAPAGRSAASAARCCARATRALDVREAAAARAPAPCRARASRRAGACSCVGVDRPGSLMDAARAELRAQPPRRRRRHRRRRASAASSRTSTRCSPRIRPRRYDWLLVIDDDVALPRGFLDAFLCAAERAGLKLAQPAHRLHSHAAWPVTRRRPGARPRARRRSSRSAR